MSAAVLSQGTPAGPSPAHPETWSPEERDAAASMELQIRARYYSDDHSQATDAIHSFKSACEARNLDYVDTFLSGYMTPEEYRKVDNARKVLMKFWKDVRDLYKARKLTADGGDFFSPKKRWFRLGNEYRVLLEPLDIANWYKAGNHLEGSGHYIDTAVDGEAGLRPSQYAFLDRLMTEAGGNYVYSLQKAKQYKDEAKQGSLQIHTLADARANPPREFKPLPPLPSTVSITAEVSEASVEERVPPDWEKGVRYTVVHGSEALPTRPLREPLDPKDPSKRLHLLGANWEAVSPHVKVAYNAFVYVTKSGAKFLVVRARLSANVDLKDDTDEHRGYFQERVKFWMEASGLRTVFRPGTYPVPPKDSDVMMKYIDKEGLTYTVEGTTGVKGILLGPSLEGTVKVARNRINEHAKEFVIEEKALKRTFNVGDQRFTWDWQMNRLHDGSPYKQRRNKPSALGLPQLLTFADSQFEHEVQGAWTLPKDNDDPVDLSLCIEQTLCYDAAFERSCCVGSKWTIKSCLDEPGSGNVLKVLVDTEVSGTAQQASTNELRWVNS